MAWTGFVPVCGWAAWTEVKRYTRPLLLLQPHPLIQIGLLLAQKSHDGDAQEAKLLDSQTALHKQMGDIMQGHHLLTTYPARAHLQWPTLYP